MSRPDISIIVPLYNENEVFGKLVLRIQSVMDSCGHSVEVILVDDGSKDQTAQLIHDINSEFYLFDKDFGGLAGLKFVQYSRKNTP